MPERPAELTTADTAHLLVVDDDARLRALLQRFLSEQGFRVSVAADAAAARAALASVSFDLLVLDVMMPGESGLELAEALRREGQIGRAACRERGESSVGAVSL